jgi:hypothetical protein
MPFAPGTRLGPYEIQSPLGAGAIVRTEGSPPLRIRIVVGWDREVTLLGAREKE